jgi:hypothetical protein
MARGSKRCLPLLWLAVVGACSPAAVEPRPSQAPPVRSPEAAIAEVLDDFHDAAARADEARYFGHLDPDSIFLGTDATERWDKAAFQAYAHPHFAKGKAWAFRAARRTVRVHPTGDVAWFDEDLTTERLGPARGSGVLLLRAGSWRIAQYNLTLTIPNERFDLVKEAADDARVLARAAVDPVHDVGWLAGAWVGEDAGDAVEEVWLPPEGGSMIGTGRTTHAGAMKSFELLRIERRDGALVYFAAPRGGPVTEFRATTATADAAVFENPAQPWPKKIAYRVEGGSLRVRVEGAPGDRVDEYTLSRAVIRR